MTERKLERLLNLLMMLLSARRPVTVERIRELVAGYDQADEESFRRMFERDKDELRELGVPLESTYTDAWEIEQGYRVRPSDYALPEISLEPDEAAAVGLAARLWMSADLLSDASTSALIKLHAAGIAADPVSLAPVEPRVGASDPAFAPCLIATRARRPITFDYPAGGSGAVGRREVEPWGLVYRKGRWYVVGHDRGRNGTRVFRLSRIVGTVTPTGRAGEVTVPDGVDLNAEVADIEADVPVSTAVVRVAPGVAWGVRRAATASRDEADGWTTCDVPLGDLERFTDFVVGFGPDVEVLSPPEARTAVIDRLRASVGAA